MVGMNMTSCSDYGEHYDRKCKDFQISLDLNQFFDESESDILNALGALMSYFGETPEYFDKAFKNVYEYTLRTWFRTSGPWIMKMHGMVKRVKGNWDEFRRKWMPSELLWHKESQFLELEKDNLIDGSFAVIISRNSSSLKPSVWNDRLSDFNNGIFNLTLHERYRAYSLHDMYGLCIAAEKVLEPYDENYNMMMRSSGTVAIIVTSTKKDDDDLFNWAKSYSAAIAGDEFLWSADLLDDDNDLDNSEKIIRLRDDIVTYINGHFYNGINRKFAARNIGYHGELLDYEKDCKDAYFSCLWKYKSDVCEKWGKRYCAFSEDLAAAVRKSEVKLPERLHFVRENQAEISEEKIKSKVKNKPTDKLSKRGKIFGIQ